MDPPHVGPGTRFPRQLDEMKTIEYGTQYTLSPRSAYYISSFTSLLNLQAVNVKLFYFHKSLTLRIHFMASDHFGQE